LPEAERPNQVLFVILTDGFENASREFNALKINEMITHQRNVYQWEFMFIGANQDAVLSAKEIGIAAANALTYAPNAEGTHLLYKAAANKVLRYRVSKDAGALQFEDADREEQKKAGVKK